MRLRRARSAGTTEGRPRAFLDVAEAAAGSNDDPAASAAVLAGIAAADAVCCHRLRRRSSSENHQDALALLRMADPSLEPILRRLLGVKTKAQYDARPITPAEAREAVKRAQRLVAAAGRELAG